MLQDLYFNSPKNYLHLIFKLFFGLLLISNQLRMIEFNQQISVIHNYYFQLATEYLHGLMHAFVSVICHRHQRIPHQDTV